MARRKDQAPQQSQEATRHPLLVYYNLGRRYRSPGILFFLMGILLLLPSIVPALENEYVDPSALLVGGGALILVGLAFWLFSRLAMHRSYVQCLPEVLLIHTPFYQVPVSYRRIKLVQPVQISQIFPRESLKGMGKPLLRPLLGKTAVEVQVSSWPVPKKRLQRFLIEYMLSTRSEAFLFAVPNYSLLIRQLDTAAQRRADVDKQATTGYQDPIARWQQTGG